MRQEFIYFFADDTQHTQDDIRNIGLSLAAEDIVNPDDCLVSLRQIDYYDGTFVHTIIVSEETSNSVNYFDDDGKYIGGE